MIAPQCPRGLSLSFARSYGYLWWQGRSVIGGHEIPSGSVHLAAAGSAFTWCRALNLVVAVTCWPLYQTRMAARPPPESLAGDTALNSFVFARGDWPLRGRPGRLVRSAPSAGPGRRIRFRPARTGRARHRRWRYRSRHRRLRRLQSGEHDCHHLQNRGEATAMRLSAIVCRGG